MECGSGRVLPTSSSSLNFFSRFLSVLLYLRAVELLCFFFFFLLRLGEGGGRGCRCRGGFFFKCLCPWEIMRLMSHWR